MVSAQKLTLFAAGSLKSAFEEIVDIFQSKFSEISVGSQFGSSGLLRELIELGERAHVFASADVGHPAKLVDAGRAQGEVVIFARNRLCALVRKGLKVTPETLIDVMMDSAVRVGTSTPRADPSGDYAFALFAKADEQRVGACAVLEAKALQLTGASTSKKAPRSRNLYGWLMASTKVDIFLTYRTNAVLAQKDTPSLQIVQVPPELDVAANYGLVVLKGAPPCATALAQFLLGKEAQTILLKHGFLPPYDKGPSIAAR